jgi:biofilm PGA synthesis lipoprotein PgaB
VVLAYHDIAEPDQALMPDFAVTPAHFQDQIAWLKEHGRHFVSVDQVIAANAGKASLPTNPVLVSFDDGFSTVYTTAFPILQRYKQSLQEFSPETIVKWISAHKKTLST